jgi:hypothetical protein
MKKNMNNNTKQSNENIKDNAIADQSRTRACPNKDFIW